MNTITQHYLANPTEPLTGDLESYLGPVTDDRKDLIRAYLTMPSLEAWKQIRSFIVRPSMRGTIWALVLNVDPLFPLMDSELFPDALTVARSLRLARAGK